MAYDRRGRSNVHNHALPCRTIRAARNTTFISEDLISDSLCPTVRVCKCVKESNCYLVTSTVLTAFVQVVVNSAVIYCLVVTVLCFWDTWSLSESGNLLVLMSQNPW